MILRYTILLPVIGFFFGGILGTNIDKALNIEYSLIIPAIFLGVMLGATYGYYYDTKKVYCEADEK